MSAHDGEDKNVATIVGLPPSALDKPREPRRPSWLTLLLTLCVLILALIALRVRFG